MLVAAESEAEEAAVPARKKRRVDLPAEPPADPPASRRAVPKAKGKAVKGKAAPKAMSRGLSALKGNTEAKTRVMRSSYAVLLHTVDRFHREVELDEEKEWVFAKGDGSGTDESDYAQLKTLYTTLKEVVPDNSFHAALIYCLDFNIFKKTKLADLSLEVWETKLDKFNCELDKPMLDIQQHIELMQEQRDFRAARKALSST